MNVFEYVKNHVNVKLAPSKIHGVGVFAIRDIEENELLFVEWDHNSGPYYITENELNSLTPEVKSHLLDMFIFKKINNDWLFEIWLNNGCHWIFKTPYHWLNSCSWDGTPNIDRDTLRTTKKIKSGEELLTKYGRYEKFGRINQNKII